MGAPTARGVSTPHELRRRLAHGLRLGSAGVVAAVGGRAAVGNARPLVLGTVLGEAALLCRVAGRLLADEPSLATLEGLGAAHARLADALTRALDPHRAALAVAGDPRRRAREALPFALVGDLDTGHRAVARHLLDLANDDLGDEAEPFARLELSWLRGLAEGCATPDVPSGSVLQRGADLLHGEPADAHRLTRAVLHATDCGLLPPRLERPAAGIADEAEALLGAALASADLDVAGELLWTWPMLGTPLGPTARYALAELGRAEATHGFVPGPEHDPVLAAGLCPADRSTYVIQTSCHTGVVAGVLAAALLRSPRSTAPAPTGRGTASGRGHDQCADADPVTILGPADGPWTDALRALPLAERMPCTPLVLGAELRTATARRDPARVRDLVAWAAVHDWAHLPSVRQGAALLARFARATAQPASLAS